MWACSVLLVCVCVDESVCIDDPCVGQVLSDTTSGRDHFQDISVSQLKAVSWSGSRQPSNPVAWNCSSASVNTPVGLFYIEYKITKHKRQISKKAFNGKSLSKSPKTKRKLQKSSIQVPRMMSSLAPVWCHLGLNSTLLLRQSDTAMQMTNRPFRQSGHPGPTLYPDIFFFFFFLLLLFKLLYFHRYK